MITIRHMEASELHRIGEIDRSEHVTQEYPYRRGSLERRTDLSVLYVSRNYQRKGVGSLRAGEVARLARADGARRLYVSATPSGSAVGFYRSHGFEPTDEPNEALFALEPDDIHMILEL
jgi:GNAT superfamily N-acetyltransferase